VLARADRRTAWNRVVRTALEHAHNRDWYASAIRGFFHRSARVWRSSLPSGRFWRESTRLTRQHRPLAGKAGHAGAAPGHPSRNVTPVTASLD
jgi:hypothetical protein